MQMADGGWTMDATLGQEYQSRRGTCAYAQEKELALPTFRVALLIAVRGVLERVHRVVVLVCLLSASGFTLERLAGLVPSLLDFEGVCGLSVAGASVDAAHAKAWGGDMESKAEMAAGDGEWWSDRNTGETWLGGRIGLWSHLVSSSCVPTYLREEIAGFLPFGTLRAKPAHGGRSLLLGLGEVFFRVGLAHGEWRIAGLC
jgi:hypothetical protein